jgi:hypothetical protein
MTGTLSHACTATLHQRCQRYTFVADSWRCLSLTIEATIMPECLLCTEFNSLNKSDGDSDCHISTVFDNTILQCAAVAARLLTAASDSSALLYACCAALLRIIAAVCTVQLQSHSTVHYFTEVQIALWYCVRALYVLHQHCTGCAAVLLLQLLAI